MCYKVTKKIPHLQILWDFFLQLSDFIGLETLGCVVRLNRLGLNQHRCITSLQER